MAENSSIEWTDDTFNPWIGCTKVSAACKHCYAETLMDTRWGKAKWGPKGTRQRTSEANWRKPLAWNRKAESEGVRRRVFCASLADVFEGPETMPAEAVAGVEEARRDLWALIAATPHLDWLLLTKRPKNVLGMVPSSWVGGDGPCGPTCGADYHICDEPDWPTNVWLGTTVEDQASADERVPLLLGVPAQVRFISAEPLLGRVDLTDIPTDNDARCDCWGPAQEGAGNHYVGCAGLGMPPGISWVIVGGESGHGARPSHPDWFRSLRDQCAAAGVPFMFKQWGAFADVTSDPAQSPTNRTDVVLLPSGEWVGAGDGRGGMVEEGWKERDGAWMRRVGKKAAGRLLDGRAWDGVPS